MDHNKGNLAQFNSCHGQKMDDAGWTADEKANGKEDSCTENPETGIFDIPSTYKTRGLISFNPNPDPLEDDGYWDYCGDTITTSVFGSIIAEDPITANTNTITQAQRDALGWDPILP